MLSLGSPRQAGHVSELKLFSAMRQIHYVSLKLRGGACPSPAGPDFCFELSLGPVEYS